MNTTIALPDNPTPASAHDSTTLPLLPTSNLARAVAQRLAGSDALLARSTVEALEQLGMGAFDRLQWTPDPAAILNANAARPSMQDRAVWDCALDGAVDGPTPALERLADALDERLALDPEHGLATALGLWFDDAWEINHLIRDHRAPGLIQWVLARVLRTVRTASGPWPEAAMRLRCHDVLSPHPHEALLPPEWQDPVGRSLVQGLMLWTVRLRNPEHVCHLIELSEAVGVPTLAWAARWHHRLPSKPTQGMGLTSAPFLLHLARMDRWTVVMWWLDRMPDPWAMGRCHRGARDDVPARDELTSVAHIACEQACGGAILGVFDDPNAVEGRLGVLRGILDAASAGHPTARSTLHHGLLNALRASLEHRTMVDGSQEQQAALHEAVVAYEQGCLREALPTEMSASGARGEARRRL